MVVKDLDITNASLFVEKSELDLYLEEPLIDRKQEIDILMWWKSLLYRSPSLVRLARDVLSIPITSVGSESAFSVGGRILKPTRSSLTSESVEALICTRNWIFGLKGNFFVVLEILKHLVLTCCRLVT